MRYSFQIFFFVLVIITTASCNKKTSTPTLSGNNITVDSLIKDDSLVNAYIKPYTLKIQDKMNTVIGKADIELTSYFPESPLSNLVADLIQKKVQTYTKANNIDTLDMFTLINIKGLRSSIPQGEIKVSDIFQLMPFENEIVLLKLSGDSVMSLFNFLGKTNGDGISGARVIYKNKKIKQLTINNKPFNPNKNYYLATSDYLANGGDYYTMITSPINRNGLSYKVREAIIDYIQNLNKNNISVVSKKDNRIKFE